MTPDKKEVASAIEIIRHRNEETKRMFITGLGKPLDFEQIHGDMDYLLQLVESMQKQLNAYRRFYRGQRSTDIRIMRIYTIALSEHTLASISGCYCTGRLWWRKYHVICQSGTIGRRFDLCSHLLWLRCRNVRKKINIVIPKSHGQKI